MRQSVWKLLLNRNLFFLSPNLYPTCSVFYGHWFLLILLVVESMVSVNIVISPAELLRNIAIASILSLYFLCMLRRIWARSWVESLDCLHAVVFVDLCSSLLFVNGKITHFNFFSFIGDDPEE